MKTRDDLSGRILPEVHVRGAMEDLIHPRKGWIRRQGRRVHRGDVAFDDGNPRLHLVRQLGTPLEGALLAQGRRRSFARGHPAAAPNQTDELVLPTVTYERDHDGTSHKTGHAGQQQTALHAISSHIHATQTQTGATATT